MVAQRARCRTFRRREAHSEIAIVLLAMVNQVLGRILRSERTASLRCPIVKQQRVANAEVIVNLKTVPILQLLGCRDGLRWALRLVKRRLDKGSRQCYRVHPDQTRRGREGSNHDVMSGWADTVNSNATPRGMFALAHSRPPCASTIDRQIDRPMPKPPALSCRRRRRGARGSPATRPGPVSRTATSTPPGSALPRADKQLSWSLVDAAHGLDGVHDQVEDHLLQLAPDRLRSSGKSSASSIRTETPFFIASPRVSSSTSRIASLMSKRSLPRRRLLDKGANPVDDVARSIAGL